VIAATYTQNQGFAVADLPRPAIGPDELLVEVMASSICGTDLRMIRSGHRKLADGQRVVLGHEFAGVIAEAGSRVAGFRVGQRVGVAPNIGCGHCPMCSQAMPNLCPEYAAYGITFDGGHAQFVRIPADAIAQSTLIELDDNVSFAEASLVEPLSCVLNGQRSVAIRAGDKVVVFGAGPIGLLHLLAAKLAEAAAVIVVEPDDDRLARARKLGADATINPRTSDVAEQVKSLTAGRGADVIITACSVPAVQEQSIALLAPFGRVCFFGGLPAGQSTIRLDTNLIHYRNLVVTGSTGGAPRDFRQAMELVQAGKIDLGLVVSHVFAQADMAAAFQAATAPDALKIVLTHPRAELPAGWDGLRAGASKGGAT
jgi:2-desacetyl-2-hydroxyethyl bacteriochlorophyllide A dehydrogenase